MSAAPNATPPSTASEHYLGKEMSRTRALVIVVALLSACNAMTYPEDVAVAEELCAKRGGYAQVARYAKGKELLINCMDGIQIDVNLGAGTESTKSRIQPQNGEPK